MKQESGIKNKIKSFTDLHVWQEGHRLVLKIYKITQNFPKEEQFGLTNQLRRAVISITSNIDINYISKEEFDVLAEITISINKLLNGIIKKSKTFIIQNS